MNTYHAIAADFSNNEFAAQFNDFQMQAEYYQWEAQQAAIAPVIEMYPTLPPAPAAAVSVPALAPLAELAAKHQDAVQATLSELNMAILNATTPALRTQLKSIATGLVNKSGLMDSTKKDYLQMLDAAEANAAWYYGHPVAESTPAPAAAVPVAAIPAPNVISPYKRKYSSIAELSGHLATASSLKEIAALYYVNAELIEQTPHLKQEFLNRKARLYRPSTAAA